eukprot:scaffold33903_cov62-Phaeocystis_antarctica.AAC.1
MGSRTTPSTLLASLLTHLLALVALEVDPRLVPIPDAHRPLAVGTVVDVGEREEVLLVRVLADLSARDGAPEVIVVHPVWLVGPRQVVLVRVRFPGIRDGFPQLRSIHEEHLACVAGLRHRLLE